MSKLGKLTITVPRSFAYLILLLLILVPSIFLIQIGNLNSSQSDKKVLAFYYNWYGNTTSYDSEVSWAAGSWLHWNENNHHPPSDLSANHTPSLGAFDAANNVTIQQHLDWAVYAGIDAFICTWWGSKSHDEPKFTKALNYTADNNIDMEWTVYFESVQDKFKHNGTEIYQEIKFICEKYTSYPKFLKENSRPVIFVYAIGAVDTSAWSLARELLTADGFNPYLIADVGVEAPKTELLDIFDGFHTYNPAGLVKDQVDYHARYNELILYSHYAQKLACYTVIPGYNDFNVCHCGAPTGRNGYFDVNRRNGDLYTEMWVNARKSNADWILICTFNEWHEGSEIEPSVEYGNFYIEITHNQTELWKEN